MPPFNSEQLHATLKQYFGFDSFRPFQEKIIMALVSGHDCLAIMPTGGGKSLCFQIPGLMMEGTIVVISPLISLMEDQVQQLQNRRVAAYMLSSSLDEAEKVAVTKKISGGQVKFIYVSPEQLQTNRWHQLTKKLNIPMVVIDEAHCISQWGHDFRPAYRMIVNWLKIRPKRPVIAAFTATATSETSHDIQESLGLHRPLVFKQDELPQHLYLSIIYCPDFLHKTIKLLQVLQHHRGQAGIIYTLTRKATEEVAHLLNVLNFHQQWGRVGFYHGGMSATDRAKTQQLFISNQLPIIVATNAFGMGVDKPDIRFVIHYQLPNSVEAYSQEVGRAGRDRQPADCYLLAYSNDLTINADLARQSSSKKLKLHQMLQLTKQSLCLKKQLASYFSLTLNDHHCGNCFHCKSKSLTKHDDYFLYQKLLDWGQQVATILQTEPSFFMTQYQAGLLSLLRPLTADQAATIPGFGSGWIRDCWPLLQSGKIYETIKEKPS